MTLDDGQKGFSSVGLAIQDAQYNKKINEKKHYCHILNHLYFSFFIESNKKLLYCHFINQMNIFVFEMKKEEILIKLYLQATSKNIIQRHTHYSPKNSYYFLFCFVGIHQ